MYYVIEGLANFIVCEQKRSFGVVFSPTNLKNAKITVSWAGCILLTEVRISISNKYSYTSHKG